MPISTRSTLEEEEDKERFTLPPPKPRGRAARKPTESMVEDEDDDK
jgi:hypothetical protein